MQNCLEEITRGNMVGGCACTIVQWPNVDPQAEVRLFYVT